MKLFKFIFLVHFLLIGDFILSQVNLDSLFLVWNDTNQKDSSRLKAIHEIVWNGYLSSNSDSAFYFAQMHYDFAMKVGDKKNMARALNTQGVLFKKKENYEKGLEYYQKSLKISEEIGYKKGMASSYNNIGNIYANQGNYDERIEYYEKCIKIYQELGDKPKIIELYSRIAGDYIRLNNTENALDYYKKSLKIAEESGYKYWMASSYLEVGDFYNRWRKNYEKALEYYQKSLKIREEIGDKSGMGLICGRIARTFNTQGNYEKGLEYFKKEIKIYEEIGDKKGMSFTYQRIGYMYKNRSNYEKALEYFNKSLKSREEIGDENIIASSYNDIADIYKNQGNNEKAIEYHLKSVKIREKIGHHVAKLNMSSSFISIGDIYKDQKNYEKALEYYQKSLEINEKRGSKKGIGYNYISIGSIYQDQRNYEKALENYQKSLKIFEERGEKDFMGYTYNAIGHVYQDQGNYEKALEYLLKSKKICLEINEFTVLNVIAKTLTEVYEKLGMPQKALENYKLYVTVKDSLAKMDSEDQLYKFVIDKENELEKQADSIKHADEIILHQAETKTQKQRSNGLALIAVIVILSLVIVFRQLKTVKKGKLLVEERNIVIEEKQKEITDSINYAKRLQDGILVPFDLVQSWLSESFILFKPKDIVSGDFYWIEKIGDKIYFAVADCTGHGIPGALVSIICSNALSKSLQEDKISSPAKMLDATRKLVEERFVRAADSIKDGMDISLCCLDVNTKTITWSGAMNPLWIVKKDAKEIQELKPDRQAIGMVENPKPFTEHKIKLVVGDSVYLFSDGYIDQFGGLKGKKYMKGKMKKFVLSLQNQSMQEQLVSFEKEFNSWKGNRDQIDDVCVMGVKVT